MNRPRPSDSERGMTHPFERYLTLRVGLCIIGEDPVADTDEADGRRLAYRAKYAVNGRNGSGVTQRSPNPRRYDHV